VRACVRTCVSVRVSRVFQAYQVATGWPPLPLQISKLQTSIFSTDTVSSTRRGAAFQLPK